MVESTFLSGSIDKFLIFVEISSSELPKILAAKILPLVTPFKATVATGIPEGICKIDNTESQPSIELDDKIGTPITGK